MQGGKKHSMCIQVPTVMNRHHMPACLQLHQHHTTLLSLLHGSSCLLSTAAARPARHEQEPNKKCLDAC